MEIVLFAAPKSSEECWARLKDSIFGEETKRSRRRYSPMKITKLCRRTPVNPESKPLLDQTESFEAVGKFDERRTQSEQTSLDKLSSEILLIITSFLPTTSSAALCNSVLSAEQCYESLGPHFSNNSTRTSQNRSKHSHIT